MVRKEPLAGASQPANNQAYSWGTVSIVLNCISLERSQETILSYS